MGCCRGVQFLLLSPVGRGLCPTPSQGGGSNAQRPTSVVQHPRRGVGFWPSNVQHLFGAGGLEARRGVRFLASNVQHLFGAGGWHLESGSASAVQRRTPFWRREVGPVKGASILGRPTSNTFLGQGGWIWAHLRKGVSQAPSNTYATSLQQFFNIEYIHTLTYADLNEGSTEANFKRTESSWSEVS